MERLTREMTFEEEYIILQKEVKELFDKEDRESEPPKSNCVVRRALRCIKMLVSEVEQYKDYKDSEEQGLLLRLPCKPKSEVFLICSRYTRCSFEDVPFEESSCIGCENDCDSHKEIYIHRNSSVDVEWIARNLNKFGKTVFLTKEEAEEKLKELEGRKDE